MKKLAIAITLFAGFSGTALAAGDIEAGKTKAMVCAACHGADGNATTLPEYPKLAGQHPKYLEKQLRELKLGMSSGGSEGRMSAVMSPMAMPLSDEDIADLAAFYASQPATPVAATEESIELGSKLYMGGDVERGISACTACHGPRGEGTELSGFPRISSQNPAYIKQQLEMFRSGERNNDLNGMMRDVAMKLTDADIEALSNYVVGLH